MHMYTGEAIRQFLLAERKTEIKALREWWNPTVSRMNLLKFQRDSRNSKQMWKSVYIKSEESFRELYEFSSYWEIFDGPSNSYGFGRRYARTIFIGVAARRQKRRKVDTVEGMVVQSLATFEMFSSQ